MPLNLDFLYFFISLYCVTGAIVCLVGNIYIEIYRVKYKNIINECIAKIISFIICIYILSSPFLPTVITKIIFILCNHLFEERSVTSIIRTVMVFYIFGSVPFSLLLTKAFTKYDIRESGSGNIGATNVLRVSGSKLLALSALILDFSKSFIPLYVASNALGPLLLSDCKGLMLWVGFSSVLGHVLPIWLNFKGGKGVATTLGVYFSYDVRLGIIASISWILTLYVCRYVSISSISMVIITAGASFLFLGAMECVMLLIIMICVIITHTRNLIGVLSRIRNCYF